MPFAQYLSYWIAFVIIRGLYIMEEWKIIEGYGTKNLMYYVSNYGKIKVIHNDGTEIVKYGNFTKDGYLTVSLRGGELNKMFVHRLVAQYFIPNPYNKPHINHIDSVRYNNHFKNLEWVYPMENLIHGVINKRHKTAKRIKKYNITNEQIEYIRHAYPNGCSYDYMSKILGLKFRNK